MHERERVEYCQVWDVKEKALSELDRKLVMDRPVLNTEDLGVEVLNVLITLLVCHRVHQHEAITFPHVLFTHGTELFLASCIQHYSTHQGKRGS